MKRGDDGGVSVRVCLSRWNKVSPLHQSLSEQEMGGALMTWLPGWQRSPSLFLNVIKTRRYLVFAERCWVGLMRLLRTDSDMFDMIKVSVISVSICGSRPKRLDLWPTVTFTTLDGVLWIWHYCPLTNWKNFSDIFNSQRDSDRFLTLDETEWSRRNFYSTQCQVC